MCQVFVRALVRGVTRRGTDTLSDVDRGTALAVAPQVPAGRTARHQGRRGIPDFRMRCDTHRRSRNVAGRWRKRWQITRLSRRDPQDASLQNQAGCLPPLGKGDCPWAVMELTPFTIGGATVLSPGPGAPGGRLEVEGELRLTPRLLHVTCCEDWSRRHGNASFPTRDMLKEVATMDFS